MAQTLKAERVELSERYHKEGCPATRAERYVRPRPDGTPIIVTRCIDCGGHHTTKGIVNG